MARKTVLASIISDEPQDGIIEFPQNRTLYADQFTADGPKADADRAVWKANSMKTVFDHFQPEVKDVELKQDNGFAYENFIFKSIKDFEDEQLIAQSPLLSAEKSKVAIYNAIIRQIKDNKVLRNALKDDAARSNLINALKSLLTEIENAEK